MSEAPQNPWQASHLAPLHVIRTETVLSRLPIHNLSKTGSFDIQITRRNEQGEVQLRWEVSHSSRYGPARQLAYKVDTVVINRRLDELGRPLPNLVRLGSLREIARELDLGGDTNAIRKALRQNAFTAIAARLTYRGADGTERKIEADFTRYSVIFAGEHLPDGRTADCVYLVLNEPYLEVLNSAPVRPLNYDYLKALAPAPQRFYEIVSYKVFAALKNKHAEARLPYSEFCLFAAVQRYFDYDHFKKQMYKIHKPHLDSGYLAKIRYEPSIEATGKPDWIMLYQPGPRAVAEFMTFERKRAPLFFPPAQAPPEPGQSEATPEPPPEDGAGKPAISSDLVVELVSRGVSENQARRLLVSAAPDQPVAEQLAWGDRLIREGRQRIFNPPGFYVYLIREKVLPPADFLASRAPAEPEPESAAGTAESADPGARLAYEEYKRQEIEHYIAVHYSPERYDEAVGEKQRAIRKQYRSASFWPQEHLLKVAEGALRSEVAEAIPFVAFEDFRGRQE